MHLTFAGAYLDAIAAFARGRPEKFHLKNREKTPFRIGNPDASEYAVNNGQK
jgi:hypothetical protein